MKLDNRTDKRKLGDIGEDVACMFLEKHGFKVIERNYLRKWGEIDIVAEKAGKLHFVEVKSLKTINFSVSSETYRPEENLHPQKLRRLYRTIETYLLHKKHFNDWQLDLVTVRINPESKEARVGILENIV